MRCLAERPGPPRPSWAQPGTAQRHTYELRSVDATVLLTDTPGLSEATEEGEDRESEARALAVRADLLLFAVDHDLIRSEYEALIELARLGKRSIVVLNKKDRFPDENLRAILAKLRERLSGVIDPDDVVAVAAAPRPLPVRVTGPDGSVKTVFEPEPPDIAALRSRAAQVLRGEGKLLHAANLLVRGKVLEQRSAGRAGPRARASGDGRGRASPVDHGRCGLRQPHPRARHPGRRGRAVDMVADLARV